jgi:hypothetical protein
MVTILIPLPDADFDPTETGVPWRSLRQRGHHVVSATPSGGVAHADRRMVTGEGLGVFSALMKADQNGQSAYHEMRECEEFRRPIPYNDIGQDHFRRPRYGRRAQRDKPRPINTQHVQRYMPVPESPRASAGFLSRLRSCSLTAPACRGGYGSGGAQRDGRRPLSSVPSYSRGAREANHGYAACPVSRVHGALLSCRNIRERAAHGICRDVCSVNPPYPDADIDLAADNRTITPHNATRAEG